MPTAKRKSAQELDIRSLARGYTNICITTLGGWATAAKGVDDDIKIRAIAILLDRGWGRPNQPHDAKLEGELRITIRKILNDE
jgi:hypothetical protein